MDRKHHQLQRGWKIWKWYITIPPSSLHSSPKHNSFLLSGQISSKELVWIGTLLGSNHKTFSQPPFCKVSFPHCVIHGRYWLIIALLFNYFCPKIYNRFGWTWWQSHPPNVIVQWENPPSKWSNISESSELDHMVPTVFFFSAIGGCVNHICEASFYRSFPWKSDIKPDDLDDHWHHGRSTLGELVYLVFVEWTTRRGAALRAVDCVLRVELE